MKKGDIWIIGIILSLVVLGFMYIIMIKAYDGDKYVTITQNQEVIHRIKINNQYEGVFEIEDGDHYNEVHILKGEIWIDSANCQNQVCVYEKPIKNNGELIVCLPHKLVVEIKSKKKSTIDIVSE